MKDRTGKTVRVGDWVRVNEHPYNWVFGEIIAVGKKAAHVNVKIKKSPDVDLILTFRARKVMRVTPEEIMLWKLENL